MENGKGAEKKRQSWVDLGDANATRMVAESETTYKYTLEFRAYKDQAWYTVCVLLQGRTLRVKYLNFSDDNDNAFQPSSFLDPNQLQDFAHRFRPLSKQVQDNECRLLAPGVRVCACQRFADDDLRFYDAVVDGVQKNKHSWETGEELCSCTFILFWLEGPNEGNLTATTIENICIVQSERELDPVVASFLEMAREEMELFSSGSASTPKGVSHLEMLSCWNKSSNTFGGTGYFERIETENQCAWQSDVKVCRPEVICYDMEDRDLEGIKNVCMILIANIDRELRPSTVKEFLHRHTSVSASVFIFPSLSLEVYTRGAIVLHSEKQCQEMCDFLNNPNYLITSSSGRPWVILEKLVGLKKIKASIGTPLRISKNILENGKSEVSNNLKVVHSGTQEFKIANDLRHLFLEFYNHQKRIHKRLSLEERKIFAANEQLA